MIINNFSQTFYLARRPGLPWAPLRSRARSEADDDPSQDEEGSAQVSDGGTYLQRVGGGRELTVADGTLLPTSTTYRLGAASMR
ncbi:BZ3500_MvSof-1268-A1-R1_Chr7-3g09604 [Microbotryum saponariae]|uniref:BZ3500_MvSof-1268-A1-R1_Chr10-3g03064 protein n=1 Tax=Microbotryum saponariae TaxID=289078 RepID=A0A2X0L609_9BASI|nr:BZ3500_MvSof-1268-A1-R1_Chr10-3g03064 [Microbotryum saponariae]SDA02271.1 BZ3500_MvSof-1268-A1-R1_Chr7-3g09604 [Microbotryum saponariae]